MAGGGGGDDGDDAAAPDAGPITMPPEACDVPPEGMIADTSGAQVVGDGSPGSCTEAALAAAVANAGAITFDCGPDPVTITLTQPLLINNVGGADGLGDTILDGGGLVTLSGGGS